MFDLIIDEKCIEPKYDQGVITIPPKMEVAARKVLKALENETTPLYAVAKKIKRQYDFEHWHEVTYGNGISTCSILITSPF